MTALGDSGGGDVSLDAAGLDSGGDSGDDASTEPDSGPVPFVPGPIPTLEAPETGLIAFAGGAAVQPAPAVGSADQLVVAFSGTPGTPTPLTVWVWTPDGGTVALSDASEGQANEPSLCALGDGFVAVWSLDTGGGGTNLGIRYRFLDSAGQPVGAARGVDTGVAGNHWLGHVACGTDGGFAIAGVRPEVADSSFAAFVQRYDADGEPVGDARVVNEVAELTESQPVIAPGPDGSYFVAWDVIDDPARSWIRWVAPDATDDRVFELGSGSGVAVGIDGHSGGGYVAQTAAGSDVKLRRVSVGDDGPEVSEVMSLPADGVNARFGTSFAAIDRGNLTAAAWFVNLGGQSRRLMLGWLGDAAPSTDLVTVGEGTFPPYAIGLAYGAGSLALAWTERLDDGQFQIQVQRYRPLQTP